MRVRPLLRLFGRFKTTPSQFKTQFLVVTINFANSKIDGEIISGDFTGNKLSELSQDQLKGLLQQYKVSDKESYILLQAYLIRSGSSTDQSNEQFKPNSFNGLSNDEAFDILGIPKTASKDEILKAHKRLMQRMHPDRGGSDYLAAKINAAKRSANKIKTNPKNILACKLNQPYNMALGIQRFLKCPMTA